VVEIADDVECLDGGGFWAVVVTFEGEVRCVRFAQVTDAQATSRQSRQVPDWLPLTGDWSSSLDKTEYVAGVSQIRDRIAAGDVYQACLCRILSHPLSDDADLISDLLASADTETARDLGNSLLLNQGFEELTKKSLLARFIKLFPSLQSLVSGESETKDEQFLVSRESYEKKRVEYEEIVSKRIPENSKAISVAREHGDLKENSEFKMAKQDQGVLMGQKAQLERDLARARITDFSEASTDSISVGTIVDLRDVATGKAVRYSVLGAWDSDPDAHRIAYKTPLGQALMGKKVGEHVKLKIGSTHQEFQIAGITRFVDAK